MFDIEPRWNLQRSETDFELGFYVQFKSPARRLTEGHLSGAETVQFSL